MKMKQQVKQNLTIKYAIALSLIAILTAIAFYTLHKALKDTSYTGYIVNISGKQRMLSQHIALDAHRIYSRLKENKDKNKGPSTLARQILKAHIQEFLQANTYLSTGKLPNGDIINLSPVVYSMYFRENNLAQRVQDYSVNAEKLLSNMSPKELNEVINYIDTRSEELLKDLNKVVNQYQKEGDTRLINLKNLETIVFMITIIMLLLEVIFIFQPMVRKIVDLLKSKEDVLNHLEETVELRTIKLKETTKKLKDLAFHDPLTGLLNRLTLEQDIEMSINNSKKHNAPYAVLMLDIDWFKDVNDTYGHDVGDIVLKEFSNILVSSVREYDNVYRAGGEEFVILFNRIEYNDVISISQKIKTLVQEHTFKIKDKEFFKTVSSGLYHSSFIELADVHTVLKSIDTALYISKTNGRNRITNVNESMQEQKKEEIDLITTLTFSNKAFTDLLKVDKEESLSPCCDFQSIREKKKSFQSFLYPEDTYLLEDIDLSNATSYITTIRMIYDKKISIYKIEISQNNQNNIVMTLENVQDISQQISDRTLIKNLHEMLDNTNDFIYFKDRNHVFTTASKTLVALTSVNSREELVGKTNYDIFDKELADEYFKLERQVFDGKLKVAQELQPTEDNDGHKGWIDNRKHPIYDEDGTIIGLFGIARIISDYEYSQNIKEA